MKKLLSFFMVSAMFFSCSSDEPELLTSGNPATNESETEITRGSSEMPIAYFWRKPETLPDLSYMTHVIVSKTVFNSSFDGTLVSKQAAQYLNKIVEHRNKTNSNVKIILMVGGWGVDGFSQVARDDNKVKKFISQCSKLIDTYGLDGVDIDWEYPGKATSNNIGYSSSDKANLTKMMKTFDRNFEPTVEKAMNSRNEHKAGERELGTDPKSGKPVFVKIGRFGPVVQIGSAVDSEKPQFAQLPKHLSLETLTLDEALELFKLPREIGKYEELPVTIGAGRFGPYVLHDGKYTSLPKGADPMAITLGEAIELIEEKRKQETQKHIKIFLEDDKLEILNGRYGPYMVYDGKNYRLPKNLHEKAAQLSYEECMKIINKN